MITAMGISANRSTDMDRWKSVPQDRKSTFEPQVEKTSEIFDIDQKIISCQRNDSDFETIEDIYGFENLGEFYFRCNDKILPQIEDWQNRPLDEVYTN